MATSPLPSRAWEGGGGRLQPVLMQHPPPAICQNLGGSWRGGRLEGVVGGGRPEGRGGFGRGGGGWWSQGGVAWGLRATHYYHMHTSTGDACLGWVWGSCWWLL